MEDSALSSLFALQSQHSPYIRRRSARLLVAVLALCSGQCALVWDHGETPLS